MKIENHMKNETKKCQCYTKLGDLKTGTHTGITDVTTKDLSNMYNIYSKH